MAVKNAKLCFFISKVFFYHAVVGDSVYGREKRKAMFFISKVFQPFLETIKQLILRLLERRRTTAHKYFQ
jgi:hypothetical protein